ncbi:MULTISPECIES: hypothetical protein [unclassified Polaromonas]|jgi:type I restriction enzyme S subunit|uniref:hypothetical protein n=1 Tax=unclassified Polaromonas TaxID=2638319 RepID=UPI0025FD1B10|nr:MULTISPECIES: hypothetical protein [unclassified Polaromonas]
MSHYKPYPAYRDSGVEWIGDVPSCWQVKRLRQVASFTNSGIDKKSYEDQEQVSLCNYTDVYYNEFITADMPFMQATASKDEIAQFTLKKGDLIITKDSEDPSDIGIPALVIEDAPGVVCGYHLTLIRSDELATARLLHRTLQSTPTHAYFFIESPGITRYGLGQDVIGDLRVCMPPANEISRIADCIDRETKRIDSLITKKTRFIELLKEKRQALITHAVTKGLDPNVKMRDSKVEWIGAIPAQWLVAQLGKISIARCDGPFGSGLKSEHYQSEGVRVIRLQNIGWAAFKDGNEAFISHEHWQDVLGCGHEVLPNDLLMGGLGDDKNPLGRACVAPDNLGNAMVKADCYRFRLDKNRATPEFIALALSATARSECGYLATGATRDRLNLGLASARVVPLPPPGEQVDIVTFLSRATDRIDRLTEKTQHSIDLLKERRSAFITAAVTGQIDLREPA